MVSPRVLPGRGTTPLSTLMPGMIALALRRSTKVVPSRHDWPKVSSNMITPEQCFSNPSVVNRSSRYARLFSSMFSTEMPANRLPIVPVDSSAARMPLPGTDMALAVATSSSAYCDLKHAIVGVR